MTTKALTLHQVLEQLQVSRKTALLLIARGKLRGFKVGRQWRFDPADVDAFVEAQKREAAPIARVATPPAAIVRRRMRAGSGEVSWKGAGHYYQ